MALGVSAAGAALGFSGAGSGSRGCPWASVTDGGSGAGAGVVVVVVGVGSGAAASAVGCAVCTVACRSALGRAAAGAVEAPGPGRRAGALGANFLPDLSVPIRT